MSHRHITWENFKQDLLRGDPIILPIEHAPDAAPTCRIFADENSKATIVQEFYSPKTENQQAYLELLNTNLADDSN